MRTHLSVIVNLPDDYIVFYNKMIISANGWLKLNYGYFTLLQYVSHMHARIYFALAIYEENNLSQQIVNLILQGENKTKRATKNKLDENNYHYHRFFGICTKRSPIRHKTGKIHRCNPNCTLSRL